jgi:hypothetical protein
MATGVDSAVECSASLRCHPADAQSPVRSIEVRVRRSGAVLDVQYRIEGEMDRVRIPARGSPRIAEQLWQHTCCELFLRVQAAEPYHEFNFSPSGEWAAYAFGRYRQGGLLRDAELDPQVHASANAEALELGATVRLERLSGAYPDVRLALAIATVIEACDGSRSHWALAHPAERPDFHHPGAFALSIDAVRD